MGFESLSKSEQSRFDNNAEHGTIAKGNSTLSDDVKFCWANDLLHDVFLECNDKIDDDICSKSRGSSKDDLLAHATPASSSSSRNLVGASKFVLASRSPTFRQLFFQPTSLASASVRVYYPQCVVEKMIKFCYTDEIDDVLLKKYEGSTGGDEKEQILIAADQLVSLLDASIFYEIDLLKEQVFRALIQFMTMYPSVACSLLIHDFVETKNHIHNGIMIQDVSLLAKQLATKVVKLRPHLALSKATLERYATAANNKNNDNLHLFPNEVLEGNETFCSQVIKHWVSSSDDDRDDRLSLGREIMKRIKLDKISPQVLSELIEDKKILFDQQSLALRAADQGRKELLPWEEDKISQTKRNDKCLLVVVRAVSKNKKDEENGLSRESVHDEVVYNMVRDLEGMYKMCSSAGTGTIKYQKTSGFDFENTFEEKESIAPKNEKHRFVLKESSGKWSIGKEEAVAFSSLSKNEAWKGSSLFSNNNIDHATATVPKMHSSSLYASYPPMSTMTPTPYSRMHLLSLPSQKSKPQPSLHTSRTVDNKKDPNAASKLQTSLFGVTPFAVLEQSRPQQHDHATRRRELLIKFYQKHNPSKLEKVDENLEKYKGREEEMAHQLARKYNVDINELLFLLSDAEQRENTARAREILIEFYHEHNPSKLQDVENLLKKYQGKEQKMFQSLGLKYGVNVEESISQFETKLSSSAAAMLPSSDMETDVISYFGGNGYGSKIQCGPSAPLASSPPSTIFVFSVGTKDNHHKTNGCNDDENKTFSEYFSTNETKSNAISDTANPPLSGWQVNSTTGFLGDRVAIDDYHFDVHVLSFPKVQ